MTQKHIDILRKEWYRLNNMFTEDMDARQLALHIGMKSGIIKAINLISQDQLATHEEQQIFDKQRNYHYTNTDNPIDFPE